MAFLDIFTAGGPIMLPLLLISIFAVAFAVERFLAFREFGGVTQGFAREVVDLVRKGREGDALRLAEETPGPIAASLSAILRARHMSVEDMERRAKSTSEDYYQRLERFLPALDTFTTLSPLLGLLGTILGMVKVFQQFTAAASEESKANILAGVGESLYATAFGITIAVFCFAVYNYFTSRQRALSLEAEQGTSHLLAYFHQQQARNPATAAPQEEHIHKRTGGKGIGGGGGRTLKKTKIEIIPMIDTMFFLLVFFILSSVGIIKLRGLQVNLPPVAHGSLQKPALITVSINAQKKMQVNESFVPAGQDVGPYIKKEVEKQAGKRQSAFDNATVVISADKDVENGLVVATIDQARSLGISHFAIATMPSDQGGGAGDTGGGGENAAP